jgi:hypothetical protein
MVRTGLVYPLAVLSVIWAAPVAAQGQWDAAGTVGVFAAHTQRDERFRYQDDWFHAVQGGFIVGRYLSRSLKIEVDGSVTGRGRQYVDRLVTVPGYPYPYPVVSESETSVRSVGAALTWQFRDNEWVHPFVRAGVSADFERHVLATWDQLFYPSDASFGPPSRLASQGVEGPTTTTTARAMLGGGAKLYVSPRMFVRTEGMVSLGRARQHVTLRAGFGVDF